MTNEAEHLLLLARRGAQSPDASSCELQAFRIVDVLRRDLHGFDAEALLGLGELVQAFYYEPEATRGEIAAFIGEDAERPVAAA